MCSYQAVNVYYYKFTIDGINIIIVSILYDSLRYCTVIETEINEKSGKKLKITIYTRSSGINGSDAACMCIFLCKTYFL